MKKILSLVLSVLIVLTIINVLKNQEQVEQSNQEPNNQEQVEQSNQESQNNDADDHTSYVPENNEEHKDVSEERKRLWGTEYQEGETHNPNAKVFNQDTGEQVQ
ncbi:hypothetical protein [Staphylococcus phage SAP6]|nr:hypothetical protein [Staphylococcus phage StAP1]WAW12263.1 hypothetical protein [Staphylococcus phage SAP6]